MHRTEPRDIKRVLGVDFGPSNMALCVLEGGIDRVLHWEVVDITQLLKVGQGEVQAPKPLSGDWRKHTKEGLMQQIESWFLHYPTWREEATQCANKTALTRWILTKNPLIRSRFSENVKECAPVSFYRGYVRIAEWFATHLDALHRQFALDRVLCEHQPSITLYENIVLESMCIQHCVSRGIPVVAANAADKYRGFEAIHKVFRNKVPFISQDTFVGRRCHKAACYKANKACSVFLCRWLCRGVAEPVSLPAMGKVDDLADAFLFAFQGVVTPTTQSILPEEELAQALVEAEKVPLFGVGLFPKLSTTAKKATTKTRIGAKPRAKGRVRT